MKHAVLAALLTVAVGCKSKSKSEPAPTPVTGSGSATAGSGSATAGSGSATAGSADADCLAQTDVLESWITAVMDPDQHIPHPWPTGDAELDAEIHDLAAKAAAAAKPADPSVPVATIVSGVAPGRLEQELAGCPGGATYLKDKVATAAPADRAAAMAGLAKMIAECGCKVSIPRIKALIYLGQRGGGD